MSSVTFNSWQAVRNFFISKTKRKTPISTDQFLEGIINKHLKKGGVLNVETLFNYRSILTNSGFLVPVPGKGFLVAKTIPTDLSYKKARSIAFPSK